MSTTKQPNVTAKPAETKGMARLRAEMNQVFFDLTSDRVLTYQDPAIGALISARWDIAVRLNARTVSLEVVHNGNMTESYDLREGVLHACEAAFLSYFTLMRDLAEARRQQAARAA